jgi:hypothetical protein
MRAPPAPVADPFDPERPPPGAEPAAVRRWGLAIALQAAALAATGLSRRELEQRRLNGQTPVDLTRSGAVDGRRVRRAVHTTARAQLDAAVASGDLSAAEARAMLGRIDHELGAALGQDIRVPVPL